MSCPQYQCDESSDLLKKTADLVPNRRDQSHQSK